MKYEDIYLHEYLDIAHLEQGVERWLNFYNHERRHQALDYETPWNVWQYRSGHPVLFGRCRSRS